MGNRRLAALTGAIRWPRMLEPLRIRDFALLWSGMTVSLVGDAFFLVALAWQTYELSNTPSALGWISAAYFAPMVVFAVVGGVLTDRMERRAMMIGADVIRAAAIGTAGALAVAGELHLWQLALFAAFAGLGDALFGPAFGSIVPEIVPRELLPQANALDQFVRPLSRLVGPALAGLVIVGWGAGAALLVDAGTFLVSTVTALLLTPRPFEPRPRRSIRREAREGFGFVRARTWLWATLLVAGFVNIAPAARSVLLPFVIKNDLEGTARALGLVYSATAAGAVLSALVFGQRGLPRRYVAVMYLGWAVSTFAIAGYGVADSIAQLLVLGFFAGIGVAIGQAIWGTMLHRLVPREVLGRVTSLDWMMSLSLMPLATAVVGFLGEWVGARATLVGAGVVGGLLTLAFLVAIPAIREPERDESAPIAEPLPEPLGERAQP